MAILTVIAAGGGDYTTISAALAACIAGDVVEIQDSATYAENPVVPALVGLTIRAATGCSPTIATTGNAVTISAGATGCLLQGLRIDAGGSGICVSLDGGATTGLLIDSCYLTGNGTAVGGGTYAAGYDLQIQDCVIQTAVGFWSPRWSSIVALRNSVDVQDHFIKANHWSGQIDRNTIWLDVGAVLTAPYGLDQTYGGTVSWSNNLIIDGMTGSAYPCLPIYDLPSSVYEVLGNTFIGTTPYVYANVPAVWVGVDAANLGNVTIAGNVINHFVTSVYKDYYGQAAVFAGIDYDCHYDCPGDTTPGGYGVRTAHGAHDLYPGVDPVFMGPGDFHLQGSSPCINASANIGLTEDRDGNARPSGLGYDIGCYEGDFTPPNVCSAASTGLNTVTVTFSEAVAGTGLTTPSAWALVNAALLTPIVITGITHPTPDTVVLSTATMLQGTQYKVTAPATITDIAGNPINTRIALFTTASYLWAYHVSEQGLRVVFDAAVKQVNDLEIDDALNPDNYLVTRDDAGWHPAILAVQAHSATEVTIKFAGPEVNRFEFASVAVAGTIAYVGGGNFPNVSARYEGCANPSRPLAEAIETSVGIKDLLMQQFGNEAGTLPVKSGDYQIETASETMKKMCIRALTTAAGEYAHAPEFGSAAKVKSLMKSSELQRVAANAKKSLLSLPNVLDAVVTTRGYNNGVLRVEATVKTKHLGTVTVSWAPAGAV